MTNFLDQMFFGILVTHKYELIWRARVNFGFVLKKIHSIIQIFDIIGKVINFRNNKILVTNFFDPNVLRM